MNSSAVVMMVCSRHAKSPWARSISKPFSTTGPSWRVTITGISWQQQVPREQTLQRTNYGQPQYPKRHCNPTPPCRFVSCVASILSMNKHGNDSSMIRFRNGNQQKQQHPQRRVYSDEGKVPKSDDNKDTLITTNNDIPINNNSNNFDINNHSSWVMELSNLSDVQLFELGVQLAQQKQSAKEGDGNHTPSPIQAQLILNQLLEDDTLPYQDLNQLQTLVLEAWIRHQQRTMENLQAAFMVVGGDASNQTNAMDDHPGQHQHQQPLTVTSTPRRLELKSLLLDIYHAAESISNSRQEDRLATMTAWANVVEAARSVGLAKWDKIKGIPQRMEYLLTFPNHQRHQYQNYQNSNNNNNNNRPSVKAVNQVLKAWAYSEEHLRAQRAEQVFQKYFSKPSSLGPSALSSSSTSSSSSLTYPSDSPRVPPSLLSSFSSPSSSSPSSSLSSLSPNGDSFRFMIRAWCWTKEERRRAFTATGYYMRMMRLLERGKNSMDGKTYHSDMEPSLEDYHNLFLAWTKAEDKNAPSKVQTVLQLAETAYRKGLTRVRPDLTCYRNALITMSQRVNLPEVGPLVDATLQEMKQDRMMIPDTECYGAAILAWNHVATANTFTTNTIPHVTSPRNPPPLSSSRSPLSAEFQHDREFAIRRCHDLLQEMIQAFHRTTVVTIQPTVEHYNSVLEAWAVSKSPRATNLATHLLRELEEEDAAQGTTTTTPMNDGTSSNHQQQPSGHYPGRLSPNAHSYRHVLRVWQNQANRDPEAFPRATEILERMKQNMTSLRSKHEKDPGAIVAAFSQYILVCAHSGNNTRRISRYDRTPTKATSKDEDHGEMDGQSVVVGVETTQSWRTQRLTAALKTLDDLQSFGLTPDSTIYAALLQACGQLLSTVDDDDDDNNYNNNEQMRSLLLERVFVKACREGHVDPNVLLQFQTHASTELYAKCVLAPSRPPPAEPSTSSWQSSTTTSHSSQGYVKVVPESWTRNVEGFRVHTKEGRKVLPLTIDGNFTFTKAQAEYKMRKLRRQSNKRMLQGGRMT